jgi:CO/xanthine dehydrogenase FAD-binding subunit
MKYLPKFEYIVPESTAELCQFLKDHGEDSRILAGGTDLLLNLENEEHLPRFAVDITRIAELSNLRSEGDSIFIGATATHSDVAESEMIKKEVPFLSEAAGSVGSVQIRNKGTIGGNIANASPAADTVPPLIALEAEAHILSQKGESLVPLRNVILGLTKIIFRPTKSLPVLGFPNYLKVREPAF